MKLRWPKRRPKDTLGYAPGHRTRAIFFCGGWHRCECGELLATYDYYWHHQRENGWVPPA